MPPFTSALGTGLLRTLLADHKVSILPFTGYISATLLASNQVPGPNESVEISTAILGDFPFLQTVMVMVERGIRKPDLGHGEDLQHPSGLSTNSSSVELSCGIHGRQPTGSSFPYSPVHFS